MGDDYLDRLMLYDRVYNFSPHPHMDSIVVSIDTSGQINLWLIDKDGWHRLTPFIFRRAFPVNWSPDGGKLLFTVDTKGDERYKLYLYDFNAGWYKLVSLGSDAIYYTSEYCWGPYGDSFIFMSNDVEDNRFDLYLYDLKNNNFSVLLEGLGGYQVPYWFYEDGILIKDIRSLEDSSLYLYTISSGDIRELTPHEGDVLFDPVAPYGDGFFLLTDYKSNFTYLAYYDVVRRVMKTVWTGKFDVEQAALGKGNLIFSVNREGYSTLYLMDLESRRVKRVYIPEGVVSRLASKRGADVFYLSVSTPTRPFEIYYLEVDGEFRRVLDVFHGGVPSTNLVKPSIDYYESFDGLKIQVVLYRPMGGDKHPVVIYLHDGPKGQSRVEYSPLIQYLLYNGIGVAKPNFRGSSGFGKSFRSLVIGDLGGGELKDVEYLMKYLENLSWVDIDKLGVFGIGLGGFLTLACITRLPSYWRVAVDWFGFSDLVSFVESAPTYCRSYWEKLVGDVDDPAIRKFLEERSPINYISNVRSPLLLIHGGSDIEFVREKSELFIDKLREAGVEVEYIVYEDEGHSFARKINYWDAIRRTVNFLIKHLT